jgi:hypothetical protein
VRRGFQHKRPCKNCPFAPTKTRIKFACRERAEEIEESAYRNGFPCHLSAVDTSEDDPENGGFVFGSKTQHCVGAIMMFLANGYSEWPGINNDDVLAEKLSNYVDWNAPHFENDEEFLAANEAPP